MGKRYPGAKLAGGDHSIGEKRKKEYLVEQYVEQRERELLDVNMGKPEVDVRISGV